MAYVNMLFSAILALISLPCICNGMVPQSGSPAKRLTAGQEAIAGAAAGFTARIAVAPIDLVKIRLQLQRNHVGGFAQGLAGPKSLPKYTGMWQTMRTVAAEEGCLALWKGNVPAQLMVRFFFVLLVSDCLSCDSGHTFRSCLSLQSNFLPTTKQRTGSTPNTPNIQIAKSCRLCSKRIQRSIRRLQIFKFISKIHQVAYLLLPQGRAKSDARAWSAGRGASFAITLVAGAQKGLG
jgi:hypothetical protein